MVEYKALSIKQPWAWLIANGYKTIENRSWNTKLRGRFYIHASKSFDKAGYQWVRLHFPSIKMPHESQFYKGAVVGMADIVSTIHKSDSAFLTEKDKPWFIGDYGFVIDNAKPIESIPCKGRLGFFDIKDILGE